MHGKEIRIGQGKHYTTEQIIGFLCQVEMRLIQRQELSDVCRKLGVS